MECVDFLYGSRLLTEQNSSVLMSLALQKTITITNSLPLIWFGSVVGAILFTFRTLSIIWRHFQQKASLDVHKREDVLINLWREIGLADCCYVS